MVDVGFSHALPSVRMRPRFRWELLEIAGGDRKTTREKEVNERGEKRENETTLWIIAEGFIQYRG